MIRRGGLLLSALPLACACHVPESTSPPLPTQAEWLSARAALSDLRQSAPDKPFGAIVRVALREPRTGKTFTARGAVAVDPHHALRLILLGPAGATALDVWATNDQWRFAVPAASLIRRGGREDDPTLPIGFFRWWFLAPLEGRLLTSVASAEATRFILRREGATVDLLDWRAGSLHEVLASRTVAGLVNRLSFEGRSLSVSAGDHATYDEEATGVHVEVTVESNGEAPEPAAFEDPDLVSHS